MILGVIAFLFLSFNLSFAEEKVFIENKGSYVHIEAENIKVPHKRKHYNRHHKKTHKYKKEKYYIAKKNGKVFHRPNCKFAKRIKNKVKFKSRKEAIKKGLRPCKFCKP
ncbi:MAG: hypothetical protein D6834_01940 [Aquificota bacterium]|nr:MAG: hypothetical protein D6834_01940 [Aquificota bacterium]